MVRKYNNIHSNFKLNGISYTEKALVQQAKLLSNAHESYKKNIGHFILEWFSDTPTILVKTSGSTGNPKPIVLKKKHVVNSAIATGTFFNLEPGNKVLHCLPSEYIAGKMMLVRAMILGLELNCIAPSSHPLKDKVASYDFAAMVPLQLENALDDIEHIRTLIIGGAPMSVSLKEKVQGKSTAVFETYGMTETITHVAVKKINNSDSNKIETLFQVLPNISISKDKRGCLVIHAPQIGAKNIVTNDMVQLISDTQFQWLGRYDTIINSGGIKLFPEQLEAKLFPFITSSYFLYGIPDPVLGQRLILLIEGAYKDDGVLHAIRTSKKFLTYEIPKDVYYQKTFVRTPNGKIKRTKTAALLKIDR